MLSWIMLSSFSISRMRTVLLCNPNTVLKEKEIGLNEREKNNVKKIILHYCSMVVVAAASMSVQGQSWSSRARQCKGSRDHRKHVSARAVVVVASTWVQGQSWSPQACQCKGSPDRLEHVRWGQLWLLWVCQREGSRGRCEHASVSSVVVASASMSARWQSWRPRACQRKGSRGRREHVSAIGVVTSTSVPV